MYYRISKHGNWSRCCPIETMAGMKKLVPRVRSSNIMIALTNRAGKASSASTVAIKMPHIVNGMRINSCLTLAAMHEGDEVTTIEGIAQNGELHPMQQAILDEQGFQCAFCMSGFIMNTVALLNANQSPTRKEAAQWLSGNLCRCADYDKILTSVMRAAEITRGA